MLINGCYHNKIVLSNDGCFVRYNFVEGILSDVNPINPFTWPGDPQVWTTCECHSGQFYYTYIGSIFSPYSCNLICSPEAPCLVISSVKEFFNNFNLEMYPNPTSGKVKLVSQNVKDIEQCIIKITDVLGREVLVSDYKEELNMTLFEKGIYFLSLYKNNQLIATKKIIKE
jgi:hypothetical protein